MCKTKKVKLQENEFEVTPWRILSAGGDFMFPNGFGMNGYWGPENYVLGAALFDWHKDFDDLPEEVKEYLTQHEYEIHSENDVDRLVRTYNQKR